METIKFTVTHYQYIGEKPKVILLDRVKGTFKNQFDTIEELKTFVSENSLIYFVADKDDNRLSGLDNWNVDEKFNFDKLDQYINK